MARQVDHEARREVIARSFERSVAQQGLAQTTFARVASDAGVSVGLIQHYFANRAELLAFTHRQALTRITARIDEQIVVGEAAGKPIAELVVACLHELLPLDDDRRDEHRVRHSLLDAAFHDEDLADLANSATQGFLERLRSAVENGKVCGEVAESVDAMPAAEMILALAHGLAAQLAERSAPATPDEVDRVIRPVINAVFTGRCHHYDDSRRHPGRPAGSP